MDHKWLLHSKCHLSYGMRMTSGWSPAGVSFWSEDYEGVVPQAVGTRLGGLCQGSQLASANRLSVFFCERRWIATWAKRMSAWALERGRRAAGDSGYMHSFGLHASSRRGCPPSPHPEGARITSDYCAVSICLGARMTSGWWEREWPAAGANGPSVFILEHELRGAGASGCCVPSGGL